MEEGIAPQSTKLYMGLCQRHSNSLQGRKQHRKDYADKGDSGVLLRNLMKINSFELEPLLHDLAGEPSDIEVIVFLKPWIKL